MIWKLAAAIELEYEKAAADIRDQITQLQNVQATQNIEGYDEGDLDLMAVSSQSTATRVCRYSLCARHGCWVAEAITRRFVLMSPPEAILEAFMPQFYLSGQQQIPQEIVTSHALLTAHCSRKRSVQRRAGRCWSGTRFVMRGRVGCKWQSRTHKITCVHFLPANKQWPAGWSRCAVPSIWRIFQREWSALISATAPARQRSLPVSCSTAMAPARPITVSSILRISWLETTTRQCSRRWSDVTSGLPTGEGRLARHIIYRWR